MTPTLNHRGICVVGSIGVEILGTDQPRAKLVAVAKARPGEPARMAAGGGVNLANCRGHTKSEWLTLIAACASGDSAAIAAACQ